MTFAEFKRKHRYHQRDLAEMFQISMRTCAYWLADPEMKIRGRSGKREVYKEKTYAVERPLEKIDG